MNRQTSLTAIERVRLWSAGALFSEAFFEDFIILYASDGSVDARLAAGQSRETHVFL